MTWQRFPIPRSGATESCTAQGYRSHKAGDKHSNAEPVSCSILTGGRGEFV